MVIPVILGVSVVTFFVIELPEGNILTTEIAVMESQGMEVTPEQVQAMEQQYGLDRPTVERYWLWISGILFEGDFGRSFEWSKPVGEILAERVPLTVLVSLLTTILIYLLAIPIGIYSAVRKYSVFDYLFTLVGFLGISVPPFLLALVLMWLMYSVFGVNMSGLFSQDMVDAPWGPAKVLDLMTRIWFPVLIIGMTGTAGLIRVMRGNLLDELQKNYVITARAKGMRERRLLFRYPVRIAVNPVISTIGWILPGVVGGEVLVSIVLNLQTTGPVLLQAVRAQDMYLAASITLILSVLTVVGTLVSDLLLAWFDPRIRFGRAAR